jgi:hypothetical protein
MVSIQSLRLRSAAVEHPKSVVHEQVLSPLLQYAAADGGKTFVLVECPSGTGQIIGRLEKDEIDVAMWVPLPG